MDLSFSVHRELVAAITDHELLEGYGTQYLVLVRPEYRGWFFARAGEAPQVLVLRGLFREFGLRAFSPCMDRFTLRGSVEGRLSICDSGVPSRVSALLWRNLLYMGHSDPDVEAEAWEAVFARDGYRRLDPLRAWHQHVGASGGQDDGYGCADPGHPVVLSALADAGFPRCGNGSYGELVARVDSFASSVGLMRMQCDTGASAQGLVTRDGCQYLEGFPEALRAGVALALGKNPRNHEVVLAAVYLHCFPRYLEVFRPEVEVGPKPLFSEPSKGGGDGLEKLSCPVREAGHAWLTVKPPEERVRSERNLVVLTRRGPPAVEVEGMLRGTVDVRAQRVPGVRDKDTVEYWVPPGHVSGRVRGAILEYQFPLGYWYYNERGIVSQSTGEEPLVVRTDPGRGFMVARRVEDGVGLPAHIRVEQREVKPAGRVSMEPSAVMIDEHADCVAVATPVVGVRQAAVSMWSSSESMHRDTRSWFVEVVNADPGPALVRLASSVALVIEAEWPLYSWLSVGALTLWGDSQVHGPGGGLRIGAEPVDGMVDVLVGCVRDSCEGTSRLRFRCTSLKEAGHYSPVRVPGGIERPSRVCAGLGQWKLGSAEHDDGMDGEGLDDELKPRRLVGAAEEIARLLRVGTKELAKRGKG